jgi:hypothetical protein
MRMGYSVPDQFAVSQFIDGGGPVAQANVDSTGKAIGWGSLPYPGENAVAAPGVLTLASGVPVPPYPFYAEANYPVTPSAEVKDPSGNYVLAAKAEQQKAEGFAAMQFGGSEKPVSRIVSEASGLISSTGATVTATSLFDGLSFGDGMMKITSAVSRSVTTYAAGTAKPETKSELLIEGAKVGDQAVTIGPDGVRPLGQHFEFPGGADQLNQALTQAGISVRTLSLQQAEGGASGEALEVRVKHPIPNSEVEGTYVYTLGGSSSFIDFGAAGPGLPPLPGGIEETPAVDGPAPPAVEASSPVPEGVSEEPQVTAPVLSDAGLGRTAFSAPAGLGGAGSLPAAAAGGSSPPRPADVSAAVPPSAALEVAAEPVALARPDLKDPGRVLMAVLAGAGAILVAASTFWRKAL